MIPARLAESGVVVIGAGVAGLAAARHLRDRAVSVTLIEAAARPGGRTHTIEVAGHPFDLGATWLHDADRNPLVGLAEPGDRLIDSDHSRHERISANGEALTPAELTQYESVWDRLDPVVAPLLQGPDMPLAQALRPLDDTRWSRLVHLWEGAIIAGADSDRLGLQDWHRNRLGGRNLVPAQGVGAFIAARLASPVTLNCPATRLRWDGPGVVVDTPLGEVRAAAAIVTVSTGVLAGGSLRFDPPLPADIQAAIHALPMGLLSKIAFPALDSGRLDLAPNTVLADRDGCMSFLAWPLDRPYLSGFVGGDAAWAVAADPRAFEDLARSELRRVLGADAARRLGPAAALSRWGADPLVRGGYAYAGPGDADQRARLAAACPGERLIFAGEAPRADGLAGTVAGAWLSGTEAAERLLATR